MTSVLHTGKPSYFVEKGQIRTIGSLIQSKHQIINCHKQNIHPFENKGSSSQSPLIKIRSSTPILNSSSQILVRNKTTLQLNTHNQGSHGQSQSNFYQRNQAVRSIQSSQNTQKSFSLKKRVLKTEQAKRIQMTVGKLCRVAYKDDRSDKAGNKRVSKLSQHQNYPQEKDQIINLSKLVKWTQSKVVKLIQRIYSQLLENSKIALKKSSYDDGYSLQSLPQIIRSILSRRYLTEKLLRQNLANLVYSVRCYCQHWQKKSLFEASQSSNKANYFLLFQEALDQQLESQDILFYLYSRTILQRIQSSSIMNQSTVILFLEILAKDDPQLILSYHKEISRHFSRNYNIDMHCFLGFLTRSYRLKRTKLQNIQKSVDSSPINPKASSLLAGLDYINYPYDQEFWSSPATEQLDERVKKEIEQQGKRLSSLLCNHLPIQFKSFIMQLLCRKVASLMHTFAHEFTNELKKGEEGKFVKKYMTMPLITDKLYQLINGFEELMQKGKNDL